MAVIFLISPLTAAAQAQTKILPVNPETNCELRYYYYPNLGAYYDAKQDNYLLFQNGQWTVADEIPSGFRGYSLFNKINVSIPDYDEDDITRFIEDHKKAYPVKFSSRSREIASASTARK